MDSSLYRYTVTPVTDDREVSELPAHRQLVSVVLALATGITAVTTTCCVDEVAMGDGMGWTSAATLH